MVKSHRRERYMPSTCDGSKSPRVLDAHEEGRQILWGRHPWLSSHESNGRCGSFVDTEGKVICPSIAQPVLAWHVHLLMGSLTCANEISLNRRGSQRCYRPVWGYPGFAEVLN